MRKHKQLPADRNGRGAATGAASQAPVDANANSSPERSTSYETDVFPQLLKQFRELGEYCSYYLSARADGAKLGLRNALLSLTLAALAFVVLASLSLGAVWFALNGAAEGLSVLCGDRPWAGNLLTGSLLAAGMTGGMCITISKLKKLSREGTVAKYENRQSRQQMRYGHSVADRAAANDPKPSGPGSNSSEQQ